MATEIIDTYDFDSDAAGLGDFISTNMALLPDEEFVVYVQDEKSRPALKAQFVRDTLTDGSTVVNLIITFDDD